MAHRDCFGFRYTFEAVCRIPRHFSSLVHVLRSWTFSGSYMVNLGHGVILSAHILQQSPRTLNRLDPAVIPSLPCEFETALPYSLQAAYDISLYETRCSCKETIEVPLSALGCISELAVRSSHAADSACAMYTSQTDGPWRNSCAERSTSTNSMSILIKVLSTAKTLTLSPRL